MTPDPATLSPYTTTVSGVDIHHPSQMRPSDIVVSDIARALAMSARWNGHLDVFYSVAEHSVLCADVAAAQGMSPIGQYAALLHDAHEAYLGDTPRPIKDMIPGFKAFETQLERVVRAAFRLPCPEDPVWRKVKEIDNLMLHVELRRLRQVRPSWYRPDIALAAPPAAKPKEWGWEDAEDAFFAKERYLTHLL